MAFHLFSKDSVAVNKLINLQGEETALLIEPSIKKMNILGLGRSVGTPLEGITAQVIVVKSFEELEQIQNKVLIIIEFKKTVFIYQYTDFFLGGWKNCSL